MKSIPNKSVDMILCDLPYGTTACKWDVVIPFDKLWEQYERVIKDNGAIVLFGAEPFSSQLRVSNLKLYKYDLVWKKSRKTYFAQAPYRFMSNTENISVFSFGGTSKNALNRMKYYPQGVLPSELIVQDIGASSFRPNRKKQKPYKKRGTNYPTNILDFPNEGKTQHPTQKPVALLEYLIKTYTQENEIVLDNTMGSGSTGVACLNTNRRFIGIEKDKNYFKVAKARIEEHLKKVD